MRTLITRGVLTVLAIVVVASQAAAAPIAIGWVQWLETGVDQAGAPVGQFSVVNQTGLNWLGDPAFPVVDQITFNGDLTLSVDPGPVVLTPGAGLSLNIDGISYDSDPFAMGGPTGATLTGTVSPGVVTLDLNGNLAGGQSLWNIVGNAITDISGNPVVFAALANDGTDLQVLYVDAEPVAAPEPAALLLIGAGLAGLVVRRRMLAKS